MIGTLLVRGMLVGMLAGLLSFVFLKTYGEPPVARAIAFEEAADGASHAAMHGAATQDSAHPSSAEMTHDEAPELFSRGTQSGVGLLVGVAVYGTAIGGLFAIAFALTYGRMSKLDPRAAAALLALIGVLAVYVVPTLKYPANPPAIGRPETIGVRTAYYFAMISISIASMIAAGKLRLWLNRRLGTWESAIIAATAYFSVVALVGAALPGVNEVPKHFPADLLWQFRIASLGAQLILWTVIGLGFGVAIAGPATQRLRTAPDAA